MITIHKGKRYIHSEYTTTAQLNKLPKEVKKAILFSRPTNKEQ